MICDHCRNEQAVRRAEVRFYDGTRNVSGEDVFDFAYAGDLCGICRDRVGAVLVKALDRFKGKTK